jgi:long-subunit fatty acid transport protein
LGIIWSKLYLRKGKVDWTKALTQYNGQLNLLDDTATGHGFGFGFYFQPDNKWDVSIAYRSPVDMKAKEGKATFMVPTSYYQILMVVRIILKLHFLWLMNILLVLLIK